MKKHNLTPIILLFLFSVCLLTSCKAVRDLEEKRQAARSLKAQARIAEIYEAVKEYHKDRGYDPRSVEQLTDALYLEVNLRIVEIWKFEFSGVDSIAKIYAISTDKMKDGENKIVTFEVETEKFSGYGFPDE